MSISFEKLDNGSVIKDEQDRILIKVNGGKVAIARFPNMSEEDKNRVADIYAELTGFAKDKATNFLNYKTIENEFCS